MKELRLPIPLKSLNIEDMYKKYYIIHIKYREVYRYFDGDRIKVLQHDDEIVDEIIGEFCNRGHEPRSHNDNYIYLLDNNTNLIEICKFVFIEDIKQCINRINSLSDISCEDKMWINYVLNKAYEEAKRHFNI